MSTPRRLLARLRNLMAHRVAQPGFEDLPALSRLVAGELVSGGWSACVPPPARR
jgi:hypothetical protein